MSPMRSFDPRLVGERECAAWVAYYRRDWIAVLRAALGLTRHAFALPWPAAVYGAWLVLHANQLWAPRPDNDPDGARREMRRFYALVAARHGESFDTARAAELEVEWWRLHRVGQYGDSGADDAPLVDAVAALYAHVYGVRTRDVEAAARQRALAMHGCDRWVREGCDPDSELIGAVRAALVRSYAALLAAVHVG
jgi:hypothetical protein